MTKHFHMQTRYPLREAFPPGLHMHPNTLISETTLALLQAFEEARDYYFHFRNKTGTQKSEMSNPGLVLGGVRIFKSPDPGLEGMIIRFSIIAVGHCHLHRGYDHLSLAIKCMVSKHTGFVGDKPGFQSGHHLPVTFRA